MKIEKKVCLVVLVFNTVFLTKLLVTLVKYPDYIISFFTVIGIIGVILCLIVLTEKK